MQWSVRDTGLVEAEAERNGQTWRRAIMPGDEALARETLGEAAEAIIASWTPEQISAFRRPDIP